MSTHDSSLIAALLTPDGGRVPVNATFRYDTDEPVAITVLFHTSADEPIEWVFSRELLLLGLDERAGESDVVIWPTEDSIGKGVHIRVTSPFGQAEFLFDGPEVSVFLDKTFELVPMGHEFAHVDLDGELRSLLDGDDVL